MQKPIFINIILIGITLFFAGNVPCAAQRHGQHEIQLGYGPLAREQLVDDAVTGYSNAFFGQSLPKLDFSNAYTVTYRYQVHRRLALALVSGFTRHTTYSTYYTESPDLYKSRSFFNAFETRFTYSDGQYVQLYGITGLGILLVRTKHRIIPSETKTYGWPTCQLTPLGMRIGKKFGGFAELGYGYKGIVNLGVSARF
jgi:hypothetical protein